MIAYSTTANSDNRYGRSTTGTDYYDGYFDDYDTDYYHGNEMPRCQSTRRYPDPNDLLSDGFEKWLFKLEHLKECQWILRNFPLIITFIDRLDACVTAHRQIWSKRMHSCRVNTIANFVLLLIILYFLCL